MPPTSCARLRDARALAALGLAAGIAVPAALLGGPPAAAVPASAVPASLAADGQPACGDPDAKEFPVGTRIQDAPETYASGGGYGTWFLDLTNTTASPCRALHPVLVLADRDGRLTAEQIQLEFSEPGRPGTEYRVSWETTDRDEQIGVFDGGAAEPSASGEAFHGFTVPAGKTVSVRVRMAFTSDARPGPVTAHAAVVQRRHPDQGKGGGREDGDWVGESQDYPFVIVDGGTGGIREPEPTEPQRTEPHPTHPQRTEPHPTHPQRTEPTAPGTRTERPGDPDAPRTDTGAGEEPAPDASGARPPTRPGTQDGATPPETGGDGGKERPGLPPHDGAGRPLPELARTGPASLPWTGAAAGALLAGGGALLLHARRARRAGGRSGGRSGG